MLTGCGVNIVEEKKLLLLKDYLKKKNINLILTNSVISDVSALTQGENVKNVILAERVGVSEVALINEEIEIIKGMDEKSCRICIGLKICKKYYLFLIQLIFRNLTGTL